MAALYEAARTSTILGIVLLCLIVVGLPLLLGGSVAELISLRYAARQDVPLVPIFLGVALMRPILADRSVHKALDTKAMLAMSVLVILVAGPVGHTLIFQGFELSRDEQMAVFDQQIFAHGQLFWPLPSEWRPVAEALNRRFMFPIGANEYWVSSYLPMHSAFRAILSLVHLADCSSAVMSAIATIALWSIARRLWPESSSTVAICLILFVTSSQFLITSMTAFSMSMHLALNLVWLSLFLKDRKWAHGLAILMAFIATGIHQPLFHPLFALPFIALLAFQRRWRLLLVYIFGYSAVCLFWLAWPLWIASHGSLPSHSLVCDGTGACSSSAGFLARLRGAVTMFDMQHLWFTAANLIRFITWQHPLLVPLALMGVVSSWRSEPLVRAVAISFLLPIVIIAIILPWQGNGWGYRYLHPVLGNIVLLAAYGFHRLKTSGVSMRRPLIASTGAAILLLPVHGLMAVRFAAPFAQVRRDISRSPADVLIVDSEPVPYGHDVVINKFDLSNRPVLLLGVLLDPKNLPDLCRRWTIGFYDAPRLAPIARMFSMPVPHSPSLSVQRLHAASHDLGCRVVSE